MGNKGPRYKRPHTKTESCKINSTNYFYDDPLQCLLKIRMCRHHWKTFTEHVESRFILMIIESYFTIIVLLCCLETQHDPQQDVVLIKTWEHCIKSRIRCKKDITRNHIELPFNFISNVINNSWLFEYWTLLYVPLRVGSQSLHLRYLFSACMLQRLTVI